jgi:guanine nucleotide-binding protein G(i) subunit alpha
MGCAESKTEEDQTQERANRLVENQLKRAKSEFLNEIKLLLLGTGESGKSTIAKQMKILHTPGWSKDELLTFRPIAIQNTVTSMRTLLQAAESMGLEFNNPELAKNFLNQNEHFNSYTQEMNEAMIKEVQALWKDKAVQGAYDRRNEIQLIDSAAYCFENVDRFGDPEWIPNHQDVLRVRARTTGIVETTFSVRETHFRMIDVGGQRNERKKWIHCFQDVTAIIYCVALNEYDMKLLENEKINRMLESLELFKYISQSKWFNKTAMILFLNKSDLFRDKIARVDLNILFEDYTGGCDYESALSFITNQFVSLNANSSKKVFAHVTCATDTDNVRVVFDAAKEIIISQNLERLGFGTL